MSPPAIRVQNVGKRYQIGARERKHTTFREAIADLCKSPWQRFRRLSGVHEEEEVFWALQDVSFEVQPGEVVGIIGRNGAGKSTLLKILSQITEPTTGRIEINGRVASLLEVGTGFHPELTGRENIFLNGAILGMSRLEIRRKFDEIVDFSGIEKFLDTPIKRYSSGMQVRLAFAVAAHLEPEILIVDEVLAVGDAAFQERCLKKMDSVASSGRTVLFVSHQMQAVSNLCQTGLELQNGRVVNSGMAQDVVNRYLGASHTAKAERVWTVSEAPGDEIVRLLRVRVENTNGLQLDHYSSNEAIRIAVQFRCVEVPHALCVGFDLLSTDGTQVLRSYHTDSREAPPVTPGVNCLTCELPPGFLNGGDYQIAPRISLHNIKWCVKEDAVVQFRVTLAHGQSPFWNSLSGTARTGVVAPIFPWSSRPETV